MEKENHFKVYSPDFLKIHSSQIYSCKQGFKPSYQQLQNISSIEDILRKTLRYYQCFVYLEGRQNSKLGRIL